MKAGLPDRFIQIRILSHCSASARVAAPSVQEGSCQLGCARDRTIKKELLRGNNKEEHN